MNELFEALAKAQGEIDNAKKNAQNPHLKNKYANLAACWDACREQLSVNGLSVVQFPIEAPQGSVGLLTIIGHKSGQSISEKFFMPVSKNDAQGVGSALTYARRYALCAAVGISPDDDDGNAATGRQEPRQQPPARSSARSEDTTDWKTVAAKAITDLAATTVQTEKGELYTKVRNSSMPEPLKTETLGVMFANIQAGKAKK